jgi:excisionase family DNA binding protein
MDGSLASIVEEKDEIRDDRKSGTMLERIDNAAAELLKAIPLEQIPVVLAFLSARLLCEGSARDNGRSKRRLETNEKLLTAGQLAKYLNLPESWIRNEERMRRLPSIRAGRYVRFELEQVQKVLAERSV